MIQRRLRNASPRLAKLADVVSFNQPAWMELGVCSQVDPEAFFPEKGYNANRAKKVCAVCPVKAKCLSYALENVEHHGVWGGLTSWERKELRRGA